MSKSYFAQLLKGFAKIKKYLFDESYRFMVNSYLGLYDKLKDDKYLQRKFKFKMGKTLDLSSPSTFSEKLQYLKLYDHNPVYTKLVDKVVVKEYVADMIGEQYIIPTIGVWNSPNEIDFNFLPQKFVMKCNHNSGLGMYICKDKAKLDICQVKKELTRGLKQNYYLAEREWPYKNVPRKILAEQYLENSETSGLTDYKIHCFNGVPRFILVCQDRFAESGLTEDFFTPEWEHMSVKRPNIPNATTPISKPEKLDEMLALAEKLAKDIPFIRVDFYFVDGKIYFSELTFFPAAGFAPFEPEEWDKIFGDWLVLPQRHGKISK